MRPLCDDASVTSPAPTQYADDRNLRARQRLWECQELRLDLVGWTLDLAGVVAGDRVLDVGCGNGAYLRGLASRQVDAVGADLSLGMLRNAHWPRLTNADIVQLPFPDDSFDAVLAPHMLYHVPDRRAAALEARRVLRPGGSAVFVTNGADHIASLRELVETAVRRADPDWAMENPSTHVFSLENGAEQLACAFDTIECKQPASIVPARLKTATIAADYVASVEDHYASEISQPWSAVVEFVRSQVATLIERDGHFAVGSVLGAFVCT